MAAARVHPALTLVGFAAVVAAAERALATRGVTRTDDAAAIVTFLERTHVLLIAAQGVAAAVWLVPGLMDLRLDPDNGFGA